MNTTNIRRTERKVVWLRIRQLDIMYPEAQRPFRKSWAKHIAQNFDPNAIDILKVAPPNGTVNDHGEDMHHVIDGQHRVAAMILLEWDEQKVPCHYNADGSGKVEDYARQFDLSNTSKTVDFVDRFLVRVTAGPDVYPDECAVSAIAAESGLEFGRGSDNHRIQAASACMDVYAGTGTGEKHNGPYPSTLARTFTILGTAWGTESSAYNFVSIKALGHLLTRWPNVDDDGMATKLAAMPGQSAGFIGKARGTRDLNGVSMVHAGVQVLIGLHNKRRTANRIEWSTP